MAEGSERNSADGCAVAMVVFPFLALAHFAAASWLSFVLFGLSGGIETNGRLTQYGGIDYAWTNLAWLPGGLLLSAGSGVGAVGLLLMMAGSGAAGFTVAHALSWLISGGRPRFGRWAWRLWVPLALWLGWVPVPVAATLTYWHTVAY